jgi:hypothetical protein
LMDRRRQRRGGEKLTSGYAVLEPNSNYSKPALNAISV